MTVSVVPYRENMAVSAKDLDAHETKPAHVVQSINDLIKEMSGVFVERSSVIRAMVTAAVAGEHCFILGKPGTAKSMLARSLAGASNLSYFEILMTKFTTPEEIFGPIKLSALQQDRFDRAMLGYLPTSQIVFLDEALATDTPILTLSGWTTMGEIRVGDVVHGSDGKPTKVIRTTSIKQGDCFEVNFRDGTSIVADAGHLWSVQDDTKNEHVFSTQTIFEKLSTTGRRYSIPKPGVVERPEADLKIDPYTLGVWLGNGNRWSGEVYIRDVWVDETIKEIQKSYPEARIIGKIQDHLYNVSLADTGFRTAAREAGLIQSPKYSSKCIPAEYVLASSSQRLSLLQGLMDTDGYIGREGTCVFSNTNEQIIDSVLFLVRSLGMRAAKKQTNDNRVGKNGKHKTCWKVHFRANPDMSPFKARKVEIPKITQSGRIMITSIRKIESVPVRCIEVDAEDHLFLAGESLTVTHNCWKSSSAILNSLLTVLNERKFHNDGKAIDIPLMQCISASNELPEGPELEALYDRFLVRCVVDYIDDDDLFIGMLKATSVQISSKINLVQAQIDAEKVKISDATYKKIGALRKACRKESITVSDRRWKQCLSILRAVAYIDGRMSTEPEDIEILEHVLWHNPDERAGVSKVIQASVSPNAAQAVKELDAAKSRFASLPMQIPTSSADRSKLLPDLASANQDLKEIADRLAKLPDGKKVLDARKEVAEIRGKVAKIASELMGL